MEAGYKTKAISLRKQGKTYREILVTIPVAKSTLSEVKVSTVSGSAKTKNHTKAD
jgi:hypothetical protein